MRGGLAEPPALRTVPSTAGVPRRAQWARSRRSLAASTTLSHRGMPTPVQLLLCLPPRAGLCVGAGNVQHSSRGPSAQSQCPRPLASSADASPQVTTAKVSDRGCRDMGIAPADFSLSQPWPASARPPRTTGHRPPECPLLASSEGTGQPSCCGVHFRAQAMPGPLVNRPRTPAARAGHALWSDDRTQVCAREIAPLGLGLCSLRSADRTVPPQLQQGHMSPSGPCPSSSSPYPTPSILPAPLAAQ